MVVEGKGSEYEAVECEAVQVTLSVSIPVGFTGINDQSIRKSNVSDCRDGPSLPAEVSQT